MKLIKANKLSVCMITYNHETYIAQAIESVLMQKTSFQVELIIGEDASSDDTWKICKKYSQTHPDKIKILSSKKNIGMTLNFIRTLKACSGQYIALCEGDDYWIDPLKLQKQVDFLEANPEFSLCFHEVFHLWEDKSHQPSYIIGNRKMKEEFIIEDILIKDFTIATPSMCFRRECLEGLNSLQEQIKVDVLMLTFWLSTKGKVKYLDDIMAVYRKNSGSVSYGQSAEYVFKLMMENLDGFNKNTEFKYNTSIDLKISMMKKALRDSRIRKRYGLLYYIIYPKKIMNFIIRNLNVR